MRCDAGCRQVAASQQIESHLVRGRLFFHGRRVSRNDLRWRWLHGGVAAAASYESAAQHQQRGEQPARICQHVWSYGLNFSTSDALSKFEPAARTVIRDGPPAAVNSRERLTAAAAFRRRRGNRRPARHSGRSTRERIVLNRRSTASGSRRDGSCQMKVPAHRPARWF